MDNIEVVADLVRKRDSHLAEIRRIDAELRRLVVPTNRAASAPNKNGGSMAKAAILALQGTGGPMHVHEIAVALGAENLSSLRSTLYRLAQEGRIRSRGNATYSSATNKETS
jgi:hypothetical protein